MYIALYDINLNHIGNVTGLKGTLTQKAYDFDEFSASGYCDFDAKVAILFILNEDDGTQIYAGLIDTIIPLYNTVTIKGMDFKKMLDTEILLDFVTAAYPTILSDLFYYIINKVTSNGDINQSKIPITANLTSDTTAFTSVFDDLNGTYQKDNAYTYLLPFMKYYNYVFVTSFDWATEHIVIGIEKQSTTTTKIKLEDFKFTIAATNPDFNKAIAIMNVKPCDNINSSALTAGAYYNSSGALTLLNTAFYGDGNISVKGGSYITFNIYSNVNGITGYDLVEYNTSGALVKYTYLSSSGLKTVKLQPTTTYFKWSVRFKAVEQLNKQQIMINYGKAAKNYVDYTPQPIIANLPISYYYLTSDEQIVTSDATGNIANRYYPVKAQYFLDDYLANAQYNAILALCEQRYQDNIHLDTTSPINPLDLSNLAMTDIVEVYSDNYHKSIPVSEITIKITDKEYTKDVKLGFKREKFTNIVKYGK